MKQTILRKLRVVLALVFGLVIAFIFIDIRQFLPEKFITTALYLQFAPSLIKFITTFSFAYIGFVVVLLLTALFGRVYCSVICPLGILQDVFTRVSLLFRKKRKRKIRNRYSKPFQILRYSILAVTAVTLIAGTSLLVNLLDPYSNFGRMVTYMAKPLVIGLNNLLAGGFKELNLYFIYRIDMVPVRTVLYIFPGIMLGLVLVLSVTRGRLYCNTVCPVGTLLGLFSSRSLFRIRIDASACNQCSLCEKVCKAECIDYKEGIIDYDRCVACFNCINVCKVSAVGFRMKPLVIPAHPGTVELAGVDGGKRRFLAGSLAWLLGMAGISMAQKSPVPTKQSTVPENRTLPVCPPGSTGIDPFNDACTACTLCVSVCPTQVLQPSFLEYGLVGFMQPRMDYHSGFCNYDCVKCTEICPTGAIMPARLEDKQLIQLGKAIFIRDNCIVHTEKTDCGACSEHCPTKAVYMVPYEGTLLIPEVNEDICVGCGACEYACPTVPYKAIFVDGNAFHQLAKKPDEQEKAEVRIEEEFPF